MAFQPPIELTWRNLFKASFLAIGDAAVVALIKDTPLSLRIAMVLASVVGFSALVLEDRLRAKHPSVFYGTLGISGAIFAGFVVFAGIHASREADANKQLDIFRNEGLELARQPMSGLNPSQFADWEKQWGQWERDTAHYLENNISPIAKNRFLNTMGHQAVPYAGAGPQLTSDLNNIDFLGKNLQEIIDGRLRNK
jgi:hypothetical protein